MVFLGFLLALAAVTVSALVVLDNGGPAELTLFGQVVPGVSAQWQVFAAGAVVAIVLMAGIAAAVMGLGRSMRLHRELRDLREEHEESVTTLEMEKRRLQRELARMKEHTSEQPLVTPSSSIMPGLSTNDVGAYRQTTTQGGGVVPR